MTAVGQDNLGTRATLNVGGKDYAFYSLKKAAEKLGDVSRLPFSMKVLLENLLRFEDGGFTVSTKDAQAVVDWQNHHCRGFTRCNSQCGLPAIGFNQFGRAVISQQAFEALARAR